MNIVEKIASNYYTSQDYYFSDMFPGVKKENLDKKRNL